jgi:hypothetical protein
MVVPVGHVTTHAAQTQVTGSNALLADADGEEARDVQAVQRSRGGGAFAQGCLGIFKGWVWWQGGGSWAGGG